MLVCGVWEVCGVGVGCVGWRFMGSKPDCHCLQVVAVKTLASLSVSMNKKWTKTFGTEFYKTQIGNLICKIETCTF